MQYGPHCQLLWIAAAIELRLQPSIIDCAHIHTNVSPVARGACVKASPGARHVGSFTESKRVIIAGVRSGAATRIIESNVPLVILLGILHLARFGASHKEKSNAKGDV